jgi:succinate-acetate transporter protein
LAFAVVTFMLSMINANAISVGVTPVVLSVGLLFGGTQLIAGLIQLRTGNTFQGDDVLLARAGNYGAHDTLIHLGDYTGLLVAGLAAYLALAELCEYSYGRAVLPVGPLPRTDTACARRPWPARLSGVGAGLAPASAPPHQGR